jgi:17beta-estradiol 17-dehydrogenase / very-long-chain 3-oxoacyl-CoA reductase
MAIDLEFIVFYIGAFFLLRFLWRLLQVFTRLFFGTKVTTERYGAESWAIVTGCTDGIGKQLALQLAERGFHIVLISRNLNKLDEIARTIQRQYRR